VEKEITDVLALATAVIPSHVNFRFAGAQEHLAVSRQAALREKRAALVRQQRGAARHGTG